MYRIRNITLLVFLLLGTIIGFSQENALKIGLLGPTIGDFSIGIEQVMHTTHTVNVNVGYWDLDAGLLNIGNFLNEGQNVWLQNAGAGWRGSVEMRNYFSFRPGDSKKSFYWGPYVRFWSNNLKLNDYIRNDLVTEQQLFNVNTKFRGFGVGAQLGYHVLLTKRLWLDFYFLGLGVERAKVKATYTAADVESFNYSFIESDVKEAFSTQAKFIKDNVQVNSYNESLIIDLPVTLPAFRGGINIAYTLD